MSRAVFLQRVGLISLSNNSLRRGVAAIGGMAAQIPIKNDEAKNNAVMDKVKADKQRECDAGHDGTWVAHPGLVKIALDIFNKGMPGPNQVSAEIRLVFN